MRSAAANYPARQVHMGSLAPISASAEEAVKDWPLFALVAIGTMAIGVAVCEMMKRRSLRMGTSDADWMAACRRLETVTVAEADRLLEIGPLIANAEESLLDVTRRVVDNPQCRLVCVVDADGALQGLLPVADLAFAAFVHVMPEIFLKYANDLAHSTQFAALSHGRTAGEVMRPPLALHPDDSLEIAFGRLQEADLEGLPIIDDANRVSGIPLRLADQLRPW